MITDKQQALLEISKKDINFDNFDKKLLKDIDIAIAYMQQHSSNEMLVRDFPINIDNQGMVDNMDFILELIQNLDVGYSKSSLMSLIKYSTSCIVRRKMDHNDYDASQLKSIATQILTTYNNKYKERTIELTKRQSLLDEVNKFIEDAPLDGFDKEESKHEKYKRCDIGFTAEF